MGVENKIKIEVEEIAVHYGAIVPSLTIRFNIENKTASDISIQNMNYSLNIENPNGTNYFLGNGKIYKEWGSGGNLNYWHMSLSE